MTVAMPIETSIVFTCIKVTQVARLHSIWGGL